MTKVEYIPENELKDAVIAIWYHDASHMQLSAYNIPFLNQELIINYGDHFEVSSCPGKGYQYNKRGAVSGIFHTPQKTTVAGHYEAIGIMLQPFGFYQLFGFPASRFNDTPLDLSSIFGNNTPTILHRLADCPTPADKIRQLEQCILHFARPTRIPPAVMTLMNDITNDPLKKGRLQSFVAQTGKSHKSLIHAFDTVLGITPQKYLRMVQLNKALRQITSTPDMPLTEVAHECGFYDQAHFIRTFKTLSGMNPSQYKKAFLQQRVPQLFPNTIFS